MNKILHALYGLKYNPFNPDIPTESLYVPSAMESFIWRIENNHVQEGGFALIVGDPGTGKSCLLRLLSQKLNQVQGLTVGTFTHPQSSVRDFYHELGDLFDIPIKPHNRWHGFKSLRQKWQNHIENNCIKPVLLIDEAQEMQTSVMNELRLLNSDRYDSKNLLTVIFAGNESLLNRFRTTTVYCLWAVGSENDYKWNMRHHNSCLIVLLICLKRPVTRCSCLKHSCRQSVIILWVIIGS